MPCGLYFGDRMSDLTWMWREMSIDVELAAVIAAAIGAAFRGVSVTGWFGWWRAGWNRGVAARVHEHAIAGAYAVARSSPVSIEIRHEEGEACFRLHLRLDMIEAVRGAGRGDG